jgi:ribonuclease T1
VPSGTATAVPTPPGRPVIWESQLPAEGRRTLALIRQGGPFPYSRDGVTFSNFERLLPRKSGGYYKEYTVPTPGESDRGARRIVAGNGGDKYYTPDHYESFKFIAEGK